MLHALELVAEHAGARGKYYPNDAVVPAKKQAEGKTRMEALRCLKRHLARRTWHLMTTPNPSASTVDTALALT